MKIVHVVHNFFPNIGGNPIQVYETARRQAKAYDVAVYTTDPQNQHKNHETIENIEVHRYPSYTPGNAYYLSKGLYNACKTLRGDILHVHSSAVSTSFATYLAFRGRRNGFQRIVFTPYFHEVASTPFRTFLHRIYDRIQSRLFFWADNVICLTEYEKLFLNKTFKVPLDKLEVIPAGLNYDDFEDYEPDKKLYDFEILYTGRLEKYKNIHKVIYCLPDLIKKFPQKKIHYTIIGKGSYAGRLKEIIDETGLSANVTLKGFVSREELVKHYKRADLFVTLANYESFGITIVEALTAGTPVVISQLPIAKDIINGNGLVVEDFNQLSAKMEYFINNEVKFKFDPKPYTWDAIEKQTTKLYFD